MSTTGAPQQKSKYGYILPSIILLGFLTTYLLRDDWVSFYVSRYPDQIKAISLVNQALLFALLTTGCWTFLAMAQRFFWQGLIENKRQRPVPKLLISIFTFIVISTTLVMISIFVFYVSPLMMSLLVVGIASLTALFFRDFLKNFLRAYQST